MSLLDRGNEDVLVYMEEVTTSRDGNTQTRPAAVPVAARAMIQLRAQSGTSARRAEQDNEGFESETVYRVRFTRAFDRQYGLIGAQSQVEWQGRRYAVIGDAQYFNGGRRTRHYDYTMRRT